MEPWNLLVVSMTVLAAWVAKPLVQTLFAHMKILNQRTLVITTATGKKITIDASQLTAEKIAEITGSRPAAHAAR
jgi:hypothetical protein